MLSLLTLLFFGSLAQPTTSTDRLIVGGHLFDSVAKTRRANPGILIRAGKIAALGVTPADVEAETLEVSETQTILAGFIDLHAHYAVDLFGAGRVDETLVTPVLFLANGVTTTFSAGEVNPEEMLELRQRIERGEAIGPRLLNSGPYFGRWRRGWDDDQSSEALQREVDEWAERGVRHFKAKGIGPEHLAALIEAAHRHSATVTGHLDSGYRGSVNPSDAIRMGIDRIEHFLGGAALAPTRSAYRSWVEVDVESQAFRDICALYIANGVAFDATMSAFGYFGRRDPEVFTHFTDERRFLTPHMRAVAEARPEREPMDLMERMYWKKRETLLAFFEAGGGELITVGTDHPSWGSYFAAFGYHRELLCFAESGLPPAAVLKCATINAARALRMDGQLGTIEVGKLADLVVVEGDPLTDIRHARDVRLVLKGGELFDAAELLESVEGKLGPRSENEEGAWKPSVR